MRLLVALLSYLLAVAAIGSGVAAVLYSAAEPGAPTAKARQETTATVSPRIQAWLERKAEGVTFVEKEKAAALAERERADALRERLAAMPEPYVAPRAHDAEKRQAAERERAARARESVKREARRQLRQLESQTAHGYAPEPRRSSYPDDFLTRRDRYGY
jgi:hypothetical protein